MPMPSRGCSPTTPATFTGPPASESSTSTRLPEGTSWNVERKMPSGRTVAAIAANQINEAISAVMGTQDDAESTSTLITRHSLREAKAGSVLVVDPNREHAIVAVSTLKKKDYRKTVGEDGAPI